MQQINQIIKPPISWKFPILFSALTIIQFLIWISTPSLPTKFAFTDSKEQVFFQIPLLVVNANSSILLLTIISALVTGFSYFQAINRKKLPVIFSALLGISFVTTIIISQIAGKDQELFVTGLLQTGLIFSVPLLFGGLSGLVCERVGVINIAIEGQLLFGAFASVVVASVTNNVWLGLIAAPISGVLLGLLLAVFSVKYYVNQMIVGVVINVLSLGLTSFFYATILYNNPWMNQSMPLPIIRIPLLADIPVIGDVLFNQNIIVYLMFIIVFVLQYMLFRSKWGLRMRSCGEHPKAADTLGIKVNRTRFRNVLLGSSIAGLGGAFFTIAQGIQFGQNISSGKGYVALAAMIMGKWNPNGTLAAACLFGFSDAIQLVLGTFGAAIPTQFLSMTPYLVTVFAIAGIVGKVTAPAGEGSAYVE
jgi:simple sugar transport system permease protein